MRRIVGTVCASVVFCALCGCLWVMFGLPPARLVLQYGLPTSGGWSGREVCVEGVSFVEIEPTYGLVGSHFLCERQSLVERLGFALGLAWGKAAQHDPLECPPRFVVFPRGFWVARTEITNEQWERFDSTHVRRFTAGDREPVVEVSLQDALRYCAWLSSRSMLEVRIPSETEWETACRAGTNTEFCFGDDSEGLHVYAWFCENSGGEAHEVATRRPNAWGVYDMHGNVSEWAFAEGEEGSRRIIAWGESGLHGWPGGPSVRGGSANSLAKHCRSAFRYFEYNGESTGVINVGFRPVAERR